MATYAIWNSADKHADITLSNGDLTALAGVASGYNSVRSNQGVSSDKWYWEITYDTTGVGGATSQIGVGTSAAALDADLVDDANAYVYTGAFGKGCAGGGYVAYGDSYTAGDIVGVALDMDNGKIWFSKNGVWQESGDPAAGANEACSGLSGTIYAIWADYKDSGEITANFGASALTYSVPSGFNSGLLIAYDIAATNPAMTVEGFTGITAAASIPMMEAEGFTGIYSAPSIPMTIGAGTLSDNMTHIESSVIIPSMTAEITQAEQIWGAVSAPMITAELTERETVLGNVEIPMMTAALSSGLHAELDASVPMMTAEGLFSGQCEATIPMITVEIEGFVGRVVNSNITVPMITAELTGQTESLVNCDVSIPMSLALAEITVGKVIVGDVTIPMMTTRVSTYEEITGDINTSIPMMEPYMIGTVDRFDCSTILRYVEPI